MKKMSSRLIGIAVHSGKFHADDVFAVAALKMYLNILNRGRISDIQIVRTRDEKEIAMANYRVDVGGKNNPDTGDFDHHLPIDPRENGVPYAAFGLIWKACGTEVCDDDAEVAKFIEENLVYSIDAEDNGERMICEKFSAVKPLTISGIIGKSNPNWDEGSPDSNKAFDNAVEFAREILYHMIEYAKSVVKAKSLLREVVAEAYDSPFIVLEHADLPWEETIQEFVPGTLLYVVYPRKTGRWQVKCIEDNGVHRKSLPEAWAGLQDAELAEKTGVKTAVSCHKGRFTCIALNREDAIALAKLAIAS